MSLSHSGEVQKGALTPPGSRLGSRILALTAATRLRWPSRCAFDPAPIRSDLRPSATARPWTLASATQRSSGSPRSRAARSSTACSSGWSKRSSGGKPGSTHLWNQETQTCPEGETPGVNWRLTFEDSEQPEATVGSENSHCLHFTLQTLRWTFFTFAGDFLYLLPHIRHRG